MLRLMQVISYMITQLEYTDEEITNAFESIEDGDATWEDLLDVLNIESGAGTMDQLAVEKLSKWRSALAVVKMSRGA